MEYFVADVLAFSDPTILNEPQLNIVAYLIEDEPESDAGRYHAALIFQADHSNIQRIASSMEDEWFMLSWGSERTVWFNDQKFTNDTQAAQKHATEHHNLSGMYLEFDNYFEKYINRVKL